MEIKTSAKNNLVPGGGKVRGRLIVPLLAAVVLACATVTLPADPIDIPFDFTSGQVISSSQMNANFGTVRDELNIHDGVIATLLSPSGAVWGLNGSDIFYNDGNVGIGRNDPAFLLHLYSSSGDVGLAVESANISFDPYFAFGYSGDYGVRLWRDTGDGSLNFDTGGSTRMTLDTAGTLSVARIEDTAGSSYYVDPASTSHLGSLGTRGWITSGESSSAGRIRVLDSSGSVETFAADGSTGDMVVTGIAVIAGGGIIGSVAANANLNVNGIVTANLYLTFSDARLKKDIAPLQGSLGKLTRLQGVSYEWIGGEPRQGSSERQIGLVAQDVETVFPELVTETDQGYLALSYDGLTALLLEAVKELKAENDLLQARIAALEGR